MKTMDMETLIKQRTEQLLQQMLGTFDDDVKAAIAELEMVENRIARCREKISACKERHTAEKKKLDQIRTYNLDAIIEGDSEQEYAEAASREGEIASRAGGYKRIVEDLEDALLRLEQDREEARNKISHLVSPKVSAIKAEVKARLDQIMKESVWAELQAWDRACWAVDKASRTNGDVANHCSLLLLTPTKARAHIPPY
ncbi:MAG: hypothetical protein HPY65_17990 [Syntrophaceae bacterium]|nr:hypothetical protein [Syntrophaceae bacterium]